MITISLANQKGGVGKTTSAIELGARFQQIGYKTVVVDLEQQSDTTNYCGGRVDVPGTYEVLKGEVSATEAVQHLDEFDLISASEKLSKADVEFSEARDILLLRKQLKALNSVYDFCIIDTNPGRNKLLQMAYIASDYIIIPTDADDGSVKGIRSVFKDLKDYKEDGWTDAKVLGVIFTRAESTSMHRFQEEQIKEILEENKSDAFLMKIRKGVAATECKTEGTSMQSGKTYSNPAVDYRKVCDKIIEQLEKEE